MCASKLVFGAHVVMLGISRELGGTAFPDGDADEAEQELRRRLHENEVSKLVCSMLRQARYEFSTVYSSHSLCTRVAAGYQRSIVFGRRASPGAQQRRRCFVLLRTSFGKSH